MQGFYFQVSRQSAVTDEAITKFKIIFDAILLQSALKSGSSFIL